VAMSVHNDVLDAALQYIEDNGDEMHICTSEPTTYTEAATTYTRGSTTPTYTGPAEGDAGDGDGRKLTVDAVSGGSVTGSGSATVTHVAIVDVSATKLLYVTSLASSQSVTAGNTYDLAAWDIQIADPT